MWGTPAAVERALHWSVPLAAAWAGDELQLAGRHPHLEIAAGGSPLSRLTDWPRRLQQYFAVRTMPDVQPP